MEKNSRRTLQDRIDLRITKSKANVFLPKDFADLGGYTQVLRALREETSRGRLVKLGYGVYAKGRTNALTGQSMIAAPGGFNQAAREALDKLRVDWEPSEAEREYNDGQSTQIPLMPVVKVNDRFSRRLSYRNVELVSQ
jgi:hypothetical protein